MALLRGLQRFVLLVERNATQRSRFISYVNPCCQIVPPRLSVGLSTTSFRRFSEDGTSSSSSESESESDTEKSILGTSIDQEEDDDRVAVLKACLHMVREGGWSQEVLAEGAKEAGFNGQETELFPNGPGDLVTFFEAQCNERLYLHLMKHKKEDAGSSKLIRPSVEHRLRMIAPYIQKWPQAIALKAFPPVAPTALENLSHMVDDIWYMAGDKSTDLNWYSKRALLATIYTSTELYMVQDASEDFVDTWRFLDNRLQGVYDVSHKVEQFGGFARGVLDTVCAGLDNMRGSVSEMSGRK